MKKIVYFNDLIKFFNGLSNLKKRLATNIADLQGIYLCGMDGISSDDLKNTFIKNQISYPNAKKFLYSHPEIIQYFKETYVIPTWEYLDEYDICDYCDYTPVTNYFGNSWQYIEGNGTEDDTIDYDINFCQDFTNLVLNAADFAVDELVDEILFWGRFAEQQHGEKIFAKVDKTKNNNEELIKTLYNYMLKNKNKYVQSINWVKFENGSIGYDFTAFDEKSSKEYNDYIIDFCNALSKDKNNFLNKYPKYKKEIDTYINNFIDFLSPEQLRTIYSIIRDEAIKINTNGVNKDRAKFLEEYPDDDKIKVKDLITIDYSPQQDYMRDKPIVLKRKYNSNGSYKDYILIGDYGTSHITVIQKPENIHLFVDETDDVEKEYRSNNFITFGYLLGKIAFIYEDNPGDFGSIDEICKILKKDSHIVKVYSCPKATFDGGPITRLAKLYKRKKAQLN